MDLEDYNLEIYEIYVRYEILTENKMNFVLRRK